MSTTVGIDLAASPKNTALAGIDWAQDRVVVYKLVVGVEDDVVLHWMHHPDATIGIDCPFGWPIEFVGLVAQHMRQTPSRPAALHDGTRRSYVYRETDRHVHQRLGLTPLSVAADRIAHVAIRLAVLMAQLGPHIEAPLDGSGALVEVYPAAALKRWSLPYRGYKGAAKQGPRNELVDLLLRAAPWLELGEHERLVRTSDHALDAILCALVARARQRGWTESPIDSDVALLEGWIHLPTAPLEALP